MKKMKLITVAAFALAAVGFAFNTASAQNVTTSPTDLILGFEINDGAGQGATSDLEIDLGSAINFGASAATFSQVLGADLTSTYGSTWATRGDLVWGVAGANTLDPNTATFLLTSQTLGIKDGTSSAVMDPPFAQVSSVTAGLNGTTALSSSKAGAVPTSQSNSWQGARTSSGTGTADFAYSVSAGTGTLGQGKSESATTIGSIGLYSFAPQSPAVKATLLGTFSLAGSGSNATFAFAPVAAPEPSAYALGICAVLLFVVLRRRSSIA